MLQIMQSLQMVLLVLLECLRTQTRLTMSGISSLLELQPASPGLFSQAAGAQEQTFPAAL